MVLKPEPMFRALDAIEAERGRAADGDSDVAAGQAVHAGRGAAAERRWRMSCCCAADMKGSTSGCGERVTEELSIGDYVLTGGELPALVILDAVARLVPGVVGDEQSVAEDSFSRGLLDFPQYTRPRGNRRSRGCPTCCCRATTRRFGAGASGKR